MDKDQINSLAEKIAEVIAAGSKPVNLTSFTERIDHLSQRLDRIEASTKSGSINTSSPSHPSMDRFAVAEAIVDSLFDRDAKEKTCTFEPNDRPCDHCSMCSSRGF